MSVETTELLVGQMPKWSGHSRGLPGEKVDYKGRKIVDEQGRFVYRDQRFDADERFSIVGNDEGILVTVITDQPRITYQYQIRAEQEGLGLGMARVLDRFDKTRFGRWMAGEYERKDRTMSMEGQLPVSDEPREERMLGGLNLRDLYGLISAKKSDGRFAQGLRAAAVVSGVASEYAKRQMPDGALKRMIVGTSRFAGVAMFIAGEWIQFKSDRDREGLVDESFMRMNEATKRSVRARQIID